MPINFPRIFGAFEIFSDIKNDFRLFSEITFNFKNRLIMKNKISSNPSVGDHN
jgi:hypothetical protein